MLAVLSSCSTPAAKGAAQGWWIGHRVQGAPRICIDLNRQVAKYYKGEKLVGAAPISSGREGHGTVRGTYRVLEKDADHRSSIYGSFVDEHGRIVVADVDARRDKAPPGTRYVGASMRCFMRITGGIGMHEGHLPGFAASHGCIRLPSRMAAIFFHATPLGTPVEIEGTAPDGPLTAMLPVPHPLEPEDIVIATVRHEEPREAAALTLAAPAAALNARTPDDPAGSARPHVQAERPSQSGLPFVKIVENKPAAAALAKASARRSSSRGQTYFLPGYD